MPKKEPEPKMTEEDLAARIKTLIDQTDTNGMTQMTNDGRWPNPNSNTITDKWGLMYSPLGYAASIGNGEVVRVLLTVIKANPNLPKHYGEHNDKRPPVVAAAAGGHINVLRAIANTQGCDVDAAGPGGYTACYGSAQMGMTACLRLLLEAGADPNKAIIDGTTPAMKASLNHNMDCLNLLIDYGCDPHHVKDDGMILPLHHDDCDESYHRGLFHENQLCARHRCISWEEAVVQESKRLHTGTTHKGKAVSSSLFAKAKK